MLRRVLGVSLLVGYGLGVIIGAGIYVLVGPVVAVAGVFAPLSFLLAGLIAALTGLCYAELGSRFPEAAGAAAYVQEGFGSALLSRIVGLAVAAVTVSSAAAVAHGSVGYVLYFVGLPGMAIDCGLVVASTAIACLGVRDSVSFATVMTVIEVGGLLLVIAAGWPALPSLDSMLAAAPGHLAEFDPAAVVLGAFLSFFAFIGFESMANMAEEARSSETTLPRAMLISLGLSTLLYVLVAAVTAASPAASGLGDHATPLLGVGAGSGWHSTTLLAAIALIAVSNGVLIQILMLSRLLYGMARRGWLPAWLATVQQRTTTPVPATVVSGAAILALTLAFDTRFLAGLTSGVTLVVFAVVDTALWRLQRRKPRTAGFAAPRAIPPLAAILSLAFVVAQYFLH